jgi:hypothetical protein
VRVALAVGAVLFSPTASRADIITLNAIDSGWYGAGGSLSGYNDPQNDNYIVGSAGQGLVEWRNFFVFDLGSVQQDIGAARLRLANPKSIGLGEFDYRLYDVTSSIDQLRAGGTNRLDIFSDLGSGNSYATSLFNVTNPAGRVVEIELNLAGLLALNAGRGGLFAIGGATIPGPYSSVYQEEFLFDYTGTPQDVRELQLTPVPEPATLLCVATGAAGMAVRRARARRKNAR